jgi:hypothetical protein
MGTIKNKSNSGKRRDRKESRPKQRITLPIHQIASAAIATDRFSLADTCQGFHAVQIRNKSAEIKRIAPGRMLDAEVLDARRSSNRISAALRGTISRM